MSPSDAGGRAARSALLLDLQSARKHLSEAIRLLAECGTWNRADQIHEFNPETYREIESQIRIARQALEAAGLAAGDRPSLPEQLTGVQDWLAHKPFCHVMGQDARFGWRAGDEAVCNCGLIEWIRNLAVGARPAAPQEPELSFADLVRANLSRVARWHSLADWSPLEWAGAMAGEAGEACNAAKKLKRIDGQIQNINTEPGRSLTDRKAACRKIALEVADTVVYGALLVSAVDEDLSTAIVEVFNRKSEEYGFPERLTHGALPVSSPASAIQPDETHRCAVCGWTLADSPEKGCVRGNCSLRPFPKRFYAPARADQEYDDPTLSQRHHVAAPVLPEPPQAAVVPNVRAEFLANQSDRAENVGVSEPAASASVPPEFSSLPAVLGTLPRLSGEIERWLEECPRSSWASRSNNPMALREFRAFNLLQRANQALADVAALVAALQYEIAQSKEAR